jgi:hypothetical protein
VLLDTALHHCPDRQLTDRTFYGSLRPKNRVWIRPTLEVVLGPTRQVKRASDSLDGSAVHWVSEAWSPAPLNYDTPCDAPDL